MVRSIQEDVVSAAFRQAMRRFMSTVTVVTALGPRGPHGMTVTAVSSVSMDPPSLLVCLNGSTLLKSILESTPEFCVNVLHQDQVELSLAFSGGTPPSERFKLGEWDPSPAGTPQLRDAQAVMLCRRTGAYTHGTHTIFIGDVGSVRLREGVSPLGYHDAGYCSPAPRAPKLAEARAS